MALNKNLQMTDTGTSNKSIQKSQLSALVDLWDRTSPIYKATHLFQPEMRYESGSDFIKTVGKLQKAIDRYDLRQQNNSAVAPSSLPSLSSASSVSSPSGGASSASPSSSSAKLENVVTYPEAPLSTKYGMDAATAFSEEMTNTAHQREVADLRKAGLNPVLGFSGSGSSVVSGVPYVPASSSAGSSAKAVSNPATRLLGDIVTMLTKSSSVGKALTDGLDMIKMIKDSK